MTLPRRRRPIGPERQAIVNDAMVPGSFRGGVPNLAPVVGKKRLDARSRGITSTVNVTSRSSKIDQFTLASSGAQNLTLTYLPITDSENVIIRRLGAFLTDDYTLAGQVVSLVNGDLAPATGDKVQVQYDYLTGVPATPGDPPPLNIPLQSAGWKYHVMTSSGDLTNYVDPAYDDSAWAVGAAPLGISTYTDVDGHAKATTVPTGNTGALGHVEDFVVRRTIGPGTGITVTLDLTNYAGVYVNGTLVSSSSTGGPVKYSFSVADQPAPWLLAVYITVANGYTAGGVDIAVAGTAL